MTIDAFIFDFGGTLDTNGVHWCEKFLELYQTLSVPVTKDELYEAYVAAEAEVCKTIAENDTFYDTLEKQIYLQIRYLMTNGKRKYDFDGNLVGRIGALCYEDVKRTIARSRKVLEKLKKSHRVGIVSNFYGNLERVLNEFALDVYLDTVVDSAKVGVRKPDPEIFRIALDHLHVLPEKAVVVGDSYERDIVPAKKLGCRTVWLDGRSWTRPDKTTEADVIIKDIMSVASIDKEFR
jgi:putative hydrolase of the HAD superfamily